MKVLVVGAGQCGLMVAHLLLSQGASVTVATSLSSLEMRGGQAQMTQLTLPSTLALERGADLDMWTHLAPHYRTVRLSTVTADGTIGGFSGDLGAHGVAVDPRVKLPDWLEYFEDRGGNVVIHGFTQSDLSYFTEQKSYDAILVAVGAGELGQLFPTDAARPLAAEAQVVSQAYVGGLEPFDGADVEVYSTPHGVVYVIPTLTVDGPAHSVMVAANPNSLLDLSTAPEHRPDVHALLPERLEPVLPELAERYREALLLGGRSTLIRRITPVVREPVACLPGGFVVGAGDAVITTEPRSGQGWAISTKSAQHLVDRMITHDKSGGAFDTSFFIDTFTSFWQEEVQHTSGFSRMINDFHSGRLSPAVLEAMALASTNQAYADQWTRGFDNPRLLTKLLSL